MSGLFDKQVNAQKQKCFRGSRKLPQPTKKCAMKMKESRIRKKRRAHNNVIDGRGDFIRHMWKGHVMNDNELQVNDS